MVATQVDLSTPCILTTASKDSKGYGIVYDSIRQKYLKHHRVVYCKHNSVALESIVGKLVRHMCNNTSCINPKHLVLGTALDNMQDRKKAGGYACGEDHKSAKLTEIQAREIKYKYYNSAITQLDLAKEYGVAPTTIHSIVNGNKWRHI